LLYQLLLFSGNGALLDWIAECGQELIGECADHGCLSGRYDPHGRIEGIAAVLNADIIIQ
jgi:hypothetical protein